MKVNNPFNIGKTLKSPSNSFRPFRSKFTIAFSGLTEGVIIIDNYQKIIATNNAVCKILSYKKTELKTASLNDIVKSEGWGPRGKNWKKFLELGSFNDYLWFNSENKSKIKVLVNSQSDFFPGFHLLIIKPALAVSKEKKTAKIILNKNLPSLTDSLTEGIIATDVDGNINQINHVAEVLTGWKNKEAIGLPLKKVFHLINKESGKTIENRIRLVLGKGKIIRFIENTVLVSRNGDEHHISASASPLKNGKDKILGGVFVFSDISREAYLKGKILESQRELSTLMGNINGIVYKCNIDSLWTMHYISPGAFRLTGYTSDDLQNNKFVAYADLIHPDDQDKVYKTITESVANKMRFQVIYRIITRNKQIKWVWEQGIGIYDSAGNAIKLEGFITDISERINHELNLYERESNLKSILDSISDGVIVFNQTGKVTRINPVAQELTGLSKDSASGKYFSDIFHCTYWNSGETVTIPIHEVIVNQQTINLKGDIVLLSKDKKEHNIRCRISPIMSAKDKQIGGIVVFSDVTEEFTAKQALKRRIISLTMPLENEKVEFSELFDLEDLQRIQDSFSEATGVASIITTPEGIPITKPSNFCHLCIDIIRNTEKGRLNCYRSDAELGKLNPGGPILQHCLSGGLFDAGASITVGKKHVANWLIGQVRDPDSSDESILKYSDEIGADRNEFAKALNLVPQMSKEQFRKIADTVFLLAERLSLMAYQNVQQSRLITDLNRTKQELHEREENLAITLNSIGDGVVSTDKHGIITSMNPMAEKLTGWTLKDACGHKLLDVFNIINADTRLPINNPVEIVIEKGIIVGLANHTILIARDGTERQIADSAAPIVNNEGVITGVVLVFSDVTNQYASRKAIEDSEKALRESQRIAELGSYVFDIEHGTWSCSDLLDNIFGITRGYEKTISGWISIIHPEWQETMNDYLMNQVIGGKSKFDKEYKIIRASDKAERWVHGRGKLIFDENNTPVKMIGTIQDISERINALNELRKLSLAVEYSPALVVITDKHGTIEYVNKKVLEMTGYTKEEVIGKNPRIWSSGFHSKHFYEDMWDTITSGNIYKSEILNKKKNGELYWESALISSLVDRNGNIANYVSVNEDITTKKEMIEELIIAKDRAEQSAKLKSEFLAQMSHEIRTPLNAIVGIVGYLKDLFSNQVDTDTDHWFESLDIASDRIIRTVELILRAAELQTSGYKTHPVKIDLDRDILLKLYTEFKSSADQKGLELRYNCNDKESFVIADEYCLTQIFANLIGNAIKYTAKGEIEIIIQKHSNTGLMVEVRDTGIGISQEFLTRIFEPFTQEEQGYNRSFEGNGLGLALVKKYCDLNNLKIEIESEKHVGSVFRVLFNENN